MAESRFDSVSKKLAARFSRRTVIKGAGVALGAGAVASLGGAGTAALPCLNCYSPCSFPLYESDLSINTTLINQSGQNGCASIEQSLIAPNYYQYDVRVRLEDADPGTYQVFIRLCNNTGKFGGQLGEFLRVGQITVNAFGIGCGNFRAYRRADCITDTAEVIVGQYGGGFPVAYWRTGPIPVNCASVD